MEREENTMGTVFAVSDIDPKYDAWLDLITEASARLDDLQTAVTEVRHLCESGDVSSEQILEVLERQGV